jgi:AraC-like DNA-binding protein
MASLLSLSGGDGSSSDFCLGLGLADIALVCGFVDQSHFSRVFTKFEGDSPGRWRQRNRKARW